MDKNKIEKKVIINPMKKKRVVARGAVVVSRINGVESIPSDETILRIIQNEMGETPLW